ncbi:hypothetical protein VTO42DRAFT_3316 [Malbranchea cinnamomea]
MVLATTSMRHCLNDGDGDDVRCAGALERTSKPVCPRSTHLSLLLVGSAIRPSEYPVFGVWPRVQPDLARLRAVGLRSVFASPQLVFYHQWGISIPGRLPQILTRAPIEAMAIPAVDCAPQLSCCRCLDGGGPCWLAAFPPNPELCILAAAGQARARPSPILRAIRGPGDIIPTRPMTSQRHIPRSPCHDAGRRPRSPRASCPRVWPFPSPRGELNPAPDQVWGGRSPFIFRSGMPVCSAHRRP